MAAYEEPLSPTVPDGTVDNNGQPIEVQPVQDGNQDAPQAAAEAVDPDPFDKFEDPEIEARTVYNVCRYGIHQELGPGYGDLEDTPVKVLFNGFIWLHTKELIWRRHWSLKKVIQEAVRIAKDDLEYTCETGMVHTSGSSFSLGDVIVVWHGPHTRDKATPEGIDFCVEEGNILVIPQELSVCASALDG